MSLRFFLPSGVQPIVSRKETIKMSLIDIASTKQFFIDDYLIESLINGPFYEQEMGEENLFGAIGLATIPLDQFVSIDSGKYVGEVTTRAFTFSGRQLHLNVAGREDEIDVRVEILGPAGHLIPGFTLEDADPITTRGLAHVVSWNGASNLSHLQGKAVKLRIYLKHAKLYGFQFR
jgi:hypothetical protein